MRIQPPDYVMKWLGPAVIVSVGLMAIIGVPVSRSALCEPEKNCLISWLGALSGWAALVGGLLTVAVMREQLSEQKRQTDHLMGNADPEIYANGTVFTDNQLWYPAIEITVINRNRRPLEIRHMKARLNADLQIGVRQSAHRGDVKQSIFARTMIHTGIHRVLAGKEDGAAAETCLIDCSIYRENKIFEIDARNIEEWNSYEFEIELFCRLRGGADKDIVLKTSGQIDF
ncbi:hypothetical protein [Agrobacterium rosae]|uniref:hypothetical protein n=1 Tax=Agrobacterium rosae TaxID=1972867 RepID=UPI003B9EE662